MVSFISVLIISTSCKVNYIVYLGLTLTNWRITDFDEIFFSISGALGLSIGQILGNDFAASSGDLQQISLTLDKWRSSVEGRELTSEVFPISVDQLFTLLFTNSKFFMDFHANRKTFGKYMLVHRYIFFLWTARSKDDFDPNLPWSRW